MRRACVLGVLASAAALLHAVPAGAEPQWREAAPPVFGSQPAVAGDARGGAVAAWLLTVATSTEGVAVAARGASGSYGDPVTVATEFADSLRVASDGAGTTAIAWRALRVPDGGPQALPDHVSVRVRLRAPDGRLAPVQTLVDAGSDIGAVPVRPALRMNAAGDAVLAWSDTGGRLHVSFRPRGGVFGPPDVVPGFPYRITLGWEIALGPDGEVTLAARECEPFGENPCTQRTRLVTREPDGRFLEPAEGPDGERGSPLTPSLAYGGDGALSVVFGESDGMSFFGDLYAATRSRGAAFGAPRQLEGGDVQVTRRPEVATGPAGEVSVLWLERSGSGLNYATSTRGTGGEFGPAAFAAPASENDRSALFRLGPSASAVLAILRAEGFENGTGLPNATRLFGSVRQPGQAFTPPAPLSPTDPSRRAGLEGSADVAFDGTGAAHLVSAFETDRSCVRFAVFADTAGSTQLNRSCLRSADRGSDPADPPVVRTSISRSRGGADRNRLRLAVRCDETCLLKTSARVVVRGASAAALAGNVRVLRAGHSAPIRLTLTKRALRLIRQASRSRAATAQVSLRAVNSAAAGRTVSARLALRP